MSKKVIIGSTIKEGVWERLQTYIETNFPVLGGRGYGFLRQRDQKMIFDEEWLSVEYHQDHISAIAGNGVMDEFV